MQIGNTLAYFYRNGGSTQLIGGDVQPYHTCFAVERLGLIEDEIAYAVVDFLAPKSFDGLERERVVTYQDVGT